MKSDKRDVYQHITDAIVSAIENGTDAYRMPWRTSAALASSPINAVTRKPYRGINILALWAVAQEKGYRSRTWATYKQWSDVGAQVRRGEKSASVVFWKFFDAKDEEADSGELENTADRRIPMAREYWVFNAEQVDGYQPAVDPVSNEQRLESAEVFFRRVGIEVKPGGNRAFYRPETDTIHMPEFSAFPNALHYYSVLAHETTHWSGAPQRLNRDLSGRFGSECYAIEELVAELGAAFLCAERGLPTDPRVDHAPYIASWLKVLKNDKRAIFSSAAKAAFGKSTWPISAV